jgi:hypothetical protein
LKADARRTIELTNDSVVNVSRKKLQISENVVPQKLEKEITDESTTEIPLI